MQRRICFQGWCTTKFCARDREASASDGKQKALSLKDHLGAVPSVAPRCTQTKVFCHRHSNVAANIQHETVNQGHTGTLDEPPDEGYPARKIALCNEMDARNRLVEIAAPSETNLITEVRDPWRFPSEIGQERSVVPEAKVLKVDILKLSSMIHQRVAGARRAFELRIIVAIGEDRGDETSSVQRAESLDTSTTLFVGGRVALDMIHDECSPYLLSIAYLYEIVQPRCESLEMQERGYQGEMAVRVEERRLEAAVTEAAMVEVGGSASLARGL
jgi:hypothetical protein